MKSAKNKKRLFGFLLTAVVVIGGLLLWPRPAATSTGTAHATCQKLVAALRSGDEKQLQSLTTTKGFADLQKAKQDPRFGSFTKLADRIQGEWLDDKTLEFLDSNRGFTRVWTDPSTWFRSPPAPLEREGMSIGNNSSQGIQFRRTPQGCKVDGYKPATEKTYQPYRRAMQLRRQSLVRSGLVKS